MIKNAQDQCKCGCKLREVYAKTWRASPSFAVAGHRPRVRPRQTEPIPKTSQRRPMSPACASARDLGGRECALEAPAQGKHMHGGGRSAGTVLKHRRKFVLIPDQGAARCSTGWLGTAFSPLPHQATRKQGRQIQASMRHGCDPSWPPSRELVERAGHLRESSVAFERALPSRELCRRVSFPSCTIETLFFCRATSCEIAVICCVRRTPPPWHAPAPPPPRHTCAASTLQPQTILSGKALETPAHETRVSRHRRHTADGGTLRCP